MERWICPNCNFAQIVTSDCKQVDTTYLNLEGARPSQSSVTTVAYGCTNPDCRQISLGLEVSGFMYKGPLGSQQKYVKQQILPRGGSKPQPEYIPLALREDYLEACAIRDLSPKAAATLVRRCLQGMIRDFCRIQGKKRLIDEIVTLKNLISEGSAPSGVTQESVEAIDQVRQIGNLGAHMEQDINLIVDVDPNEAQVLIELVEMLFEEWYVSRHLRQERLAHIGKIAKLKEEARKA